jgi:AraC family transcriptional regulator, transcriptional activator of pobA
MDDAGNVWYFPAMITVTNPIPAWQLYGEDSPFPDLLHIERIVDRAAGLDWRIAPHRHLHLHQVFLILSGQVELQLDGRTLTPSPPTLMNIPRNAVHGFAFSAGTEGYVLTLPAADFPELFGAGSATAPGLARAFVASGAAELTDSLAMIADLHAATGPLRRLRLRAAVIALGCAVAEAAGTELATNGDQRIAAFEALIRNQQSQGWHLTDYANALALSERHLRRLCIEATGHSARRLIEAVHLREACRLLAYTRMQVQEVGFALGYDDPAYFTRVFRRGVGMSPVEYRVRLE